MIDISINKFKRIEGETGLFCFEDCIVSIAKYFDVDYELMYSDGYLLKKDLKRNTTSFASNYSISAINRLENLKKLNGLLYEKIKCNTDNNWIEIIKTQILHNKPMLASFETYWCPWDNGFQRFRGVKHNFIIKGIVDNEIICVDPYFNLDNIALTYDNFFKGIDFLIIFEKYDMSQKSDKNYIKILKNLYKNINMNGYIETLKTLCNDFFCSGDLFEEVDGDDNFWISPIVIIFLLINQSISTLAIHATYIAGQIGNSGNYVERLGKRLWNESVKWKQLRKLIMKLYFIKKSDENLKNRICERMKEIINELEILFLSVENIELLDENIKHCIISNDIIKQQNMIDLSCHFNNKAFQNNKNSLADFTSIGHCFIPNETEYNLWYIDNINFNMKFINTNIYDNIACDGQKIRCNGKVYSHLAIIGASEFGDSNDIIKIEYTNGVVEEVEFQLSDYIGSPNFCENIAWNGRGRYRSQNEISMDEELYLFEKKYKVIENYNFKYIELPINPSMHIFAITLI